MIDYFITHWWTTFSVSASASLLALAISLVLSILALQLRYLGVALGAFSAVSQSFPLQAIAPLILIWMGTGFQTNLLIAFLITFFPLYGNLASAISRRRTENLAFLSSCGNESKLDELMVIVPATMPEIFGSAKISFTLATLGAVVAEFILPNGGLGYVIILAITNYNFTNVYVAVAILATQGILIYSIFSYLEYNSLSNRGEIK